MAKEPKSSKMYKDSPKMERGEDGKMSVAKKVPAADKSKEVVPEHEAKVTAMMHKHSEERMKMHHAHEKEHMELMHAAVKEGSPAEEKTETKAEEKAETPKKEAKEKKEGVL